MVSPGYEGPYLLGIDYGTESCCTTIFDLHGNSMGFAAIPYETEFPRSGQTGQPPDDRWEVLGVSAYRVLNQTGIPARHIAAICVDAITMAVITPDEEDNALRSAIMWMDVRITEQTVCDGVFDY